MTHRILFALLAACTWPAIGDAANPVTWTIDESITDSDNLIEWTSPTAIDLGLATYAWSYEITDAVGYSGIFSFDILPLLGDLTAGEGTTQSLPAVLLDDVLAEESTGTMADIFIEVDEAGFGQATFSNLELGEFDLGLSTIPITRIDITALVTIQGFGAGDYNLDGQVGPADFATWKASFGDVGESPADSNRNGVVDAADYTIWRDQFGAGAVTGGAAVPEPTSALMALIALGIFAIGYGRRSAI